jgi:hypothetical protein
MLLTCVRFWLPRNEITKQIVVCMSGVVTLSRVLQGQLHSLVYGG